MSDEIQPEVAHQAAATGEADTSMEDGVMESLFTSRGTGCWRIIFGSPAVYIVPPPRGP